MSTVALLQSTRRHRNSFGSTASAGMETTTAAKSTWIAAGNVYVSGNYYSTQATFGLSPSRIQGGSDAFVTKLDADGTFQWARGLGRAGDSDCRRALRGRRRQFPRVPAISITPQWISIRGLESSRFLAREVRTGTTRTSTVVEISVRHWAVGGSGSDSVKGVVSDTAGNVYVVGNFQETAQFGTSNGTAPVYLTSRGSSDSFLMQVTPAGHTEWIRQASGPDLVNLPNVGFDGSGGIYFTGRFADTMDFGPGTPSLTSSGSYGRLHQQMGHGWQPTLDRPN